MPTGNSALMSTATRTTSHRGKLDVEYAGGWGCVGSGLRSLVQASASPAAVTSSLVRKGRRTGSPELGLAASYHPCGVIAATLALGQWPVPASCRYRGSLRKSRNHHCESFAKSTRRSGLAATYRFSNCSASSRSPSSVRTKASK